MLAWLFWYLENRWALCSHVSVHVVFLVCLKFCVYSITCVSQLLRVHVLNFGSSLYATCSQIPELVGMWPWRGYRGWSYSINICTHNLLSYVVSPSAPGSVPVAACASDGVGWLFSPCTKVAALCHDLSAWMNFEQVTFPLLSLSCHSACLILRSYKPCRERLERVKLINLLW